MQTRPPILFRLRSNGKFIGLVVGFAIFTDLFLYGVVVPILPYALTPRFGVPEVQVQSKTSVLLAVYAAGLLASCPFVGWFADKSSSRRVPLLLGLFALVGSTLLFTLGKTYALLILARILQGVSASVVWTVGLALLVDTVGKDKLGAAMGSVSIFLSIGIALGPVLGGIVYDVGGYYAPFYMCFGILAIDILLRLVIIEKKKKKEEKKMSNRLYTEADTTTTTTTTFSDFRQESLATHGKKKFQVPPIISLLCSSRILAGCWLGFVAAFILSSFDAVLPLYLKDLWGFSPLDSGLVYASLTLPSFVVSPIAGWFVDTRGTKSITLLGLILSIPFLIVLRFPNATSPRAGQIVEFCFLLALNGASSALLLTASMTEIALVVGDQELERPGLFGDSGAFAQAYALFNMSFSGGTLAGPLVAGAIRDASDWGTMVWAIALLPAVTLVPCTIWTGGKIKDTHWIKARDEKTQDQSASTEQDGNQCLHE